MWEQCFGRGVQRFFWAAGVSDGRRSHASSLCRPHSDEAGDVSRLVRQCSSEAASVTCRSRSHEISRNRPAPCVQVISLLIDLTQVFDTETPTVLVLRASLLFFFSFEGTI